MKKKLFASILTLLSFIGMSQKSEFVISHNNNDSLASLFNNSFESNDWLLDSTIQFYSFEYDSFDFYDKWKVISRNESGFPTFAVYQFFDGETQEFKNYREVSYNYESSTNKYPHTIEIKELDNSSLNIINSDKIYYSDSYSQNHINIHYKWIGNIWLEYSKELFTIYEDSTIRIIQRWNNDQQQWINKTKYKQTFGSSQIIADLKWENNRWNLNQIETFKYDEYGNLILYSDQQMRSNGLRNRSKNVFVYDEHQNIILDTLYDGKDSSWREGEIRTYAYNENQYLIYEDEISYSYLFNHWINKYKKIYDVDSIGNIISTLCYSGNYDSIWYLDRRYSYSYNDLNLMFSSTAEKYIDSNDIWVNTGRIEYDYYDTLLISRLGSEWDSVNNLWFKRSRKIYVYDSKNRLIEKYTEITEDNGASWQPNGTKYEYVFEQTNSHRLYKSKLSYFNFNENLWVVNRSMENHWNKYINGIDEIKLDAFSLYPNPAKNYIYIKSNKLFKQPYLVHILNSNGKTIDILRIRNNQPISIKGLNKSTYFLKIIFSDTFVVLPFIKN